MELWEGKRKVVTATAALLAVMLMFTLISKSVYAYQLPQITTEEARKRTVGREINLSGFVSQSREYAESVLPSIRVDTVNVGRGDEIEEGTLLFTLNEADLKEQIAEKELAVKKLQVQIATLRHNQQLADENKIQNTDRALEDYVGAASDHSVQADRALTKEEQAQQDLQKHLEDAPEITRNSDREAAKEEYEQWIERGKALKSELENATQRLADAQKKADELQAAYDEAKKAAGVNFSADTVKTAEGQTVSEGEQEPEAQAESADIPEPDTQPESREESGPVEQPAPEEESAPEETPVMEETPDGGLETAPTEEKQPDAPGSRPPQNSDGGTESESEAGSLTGDGTNLEELKRRLDAAVAERDACQEALRRAEKNMQDYQEESRTKPDFAAEDAEKKNWESQKDTLERNVQSARWDYDDSLRQKQKALEEAQRRVDDAAAPESIQDTLALYQLELAYEQEVLNRYRELQKKGGQVTAGESGIITGVNVSAGNDTPDGAAIVYAAKENDLKFQTTLSKEEKKYVNQGTEGKLAFGDGMEQSLSVDYMEQQTDGGYSAEIFLPEGVGKMGESGTFRVNYQSRPYYQCIPVNALHGENQRFYIYVVRRQQGILGEELAAEKRFVNVLEQGDSYAALADGTLAEGEEVIVSSTKDLTDGAVVRYRLQESAD